MFAIFIIVKSRNKEQLVILTLHSASFKLSLVLQPKNIARSQIEMEILCLTWKLNLFYFINHVLLLLARSQIQQQCCSSLITFKQKYLRLFLCCHRHSILVVQILWFRFKNKVVLYFKFNAIFCLLVIPTKVKKRILQ